MRGVLICFGVGVVALTAQTTIIFGTWEASRAGAFAAPAGKGAVANIPTTCTTGEEYFADRRDGGAENKYFCTATNTWTRESGSSGGGGAITYADSLLDGSTWTLADREHGRLKLRSGSGAAGPRIGRCRRE